MYGYKNFDIISFNLGMIESFCEMVANRVKRLAFSPAIEKDNLTTIKKAVLNIVVKYHLKFYLEDDLILNNIAPADYAKDKYIFLIYEDDAALVKYFELKKRQRIHVKNGTYNEQIRKEITLDLCRLLGYPEELIEEKYM